MATSSSFEKALLEQIEEGEFEAPLRAAEAALSDEASPEKRARLAYIAAYALYGLDRTEEAAARLSESIAAGDSPEARELEAWLAMDRGDFEGALAAATRGVELDPEDAGAHNLRGLALTQLRRIPEADDAFRLAAELDPESYFLPFRMKREEFDSAVDEALADIPEVFVQQLENVQFAVEDVPSGENEWDLLGLYQGHTIHEPSFGDLPDLILLFQRNLENVSPDRETLLEEIRDTVLHEVGHHMGMEEEELEEIEDGDWDE